MRYMRMDLQTADLGRYSTLAYPRSYGGKGYSEKEIERNGGSLSW